MLEEPDNDPTVDLVDAVDPQALEALVLTLPVPAPGGLGRLMAAARGQARFDPFIDRVSSLLDLPTKKAERYLAEIDGGGRFRQLWPGIQMRPVKPGPGFPGTSGAIFKVDGGVTFPYHRHVGGPERALILQGRCTETGDAFLSAGDWFERAEGSAHAFEVPLGEDLVFVVLSHGFELG